MKKIYGTMPVAALLLAVFFAGLQSFRLKPARVVTESWFAYTPIFPSTDKTDPANYTFMAGTPSCNSSTTLCAVEATIDPNTVNEEHPELQKPLESDSGDDISLDDLSTASSGFTTSADGVRYKP
jgi:hypothetical protein